LNKTLSAVLYDLGVAAKKMDFLKLGFNRELAVRFSCLEQNLRYDKKALMEKSMSEYQEAIDSVSLYANTFFESCFNEGAVLINALASLKLASESKSPRLVELAELYDSTTKALVTRLNESFQIIAKDTLDRQCYDEAIAWLHGLDQHFMRLKDHIQATDLGFDCKTQLQVYAATGTWTLKVLMQK
jgi:hypothetical protein